MKTEVMSISQFLHREKEPFHLKVERHFKKYGLAYKIAGITIIFLASGGSALAAGVGTASLDHEAYRLYREVLRLGKWIIIIKGGIDIIKCVGDGDVDGAKKRFFSSVVIYLILLGLPYGLQKVDDIFSRITKI